MCFSVACTTINTILSEAVGLALPVLALLVLALLVLALPAMFHKRPPALRHSPALLYPLLSLCKNNKQHTQALRSCTK